MEAEALQEVDSKLETEIDQLKNEIIAELETFKTVLLQDSNNPHITRNKLKDRLRFVIWMAQKYRLRSKQPPPVVKQREVFYCELGENIGCEQDIKRPVVIIQNDLGNSTGDTVVIAPITSYQNSNFYSKDGIDYVKYFDNNGLPVERSLKFYEILVRLEPNPKREIIGVVNVAHIREISKKRLAKVPVAKITTGTLKRVVEAVGGNLRVIK